MPSHAFRVLLSSLLFSQLPLFQTDALAQSCERPRLGIGRPKIVGGLEADIRNWPWQISLRSKNPDGSLFYFCGGTIIGSDAVLTAAHCVVGLKKSGANWVDTDGSIVEVVIGVGDLRKTRPEQVRQISDVKVHEAYAAALAANVTAGGSDVAIVNISSPWAGPKARLSLSGSNDPRTPPGAVLAVAGYGLQVTGKLGGAAVNYKQVDNVPFAAGSDRLQEVGIDLIAEPKCLAGAGLATMPTGQMCAGSEYGGHDSCKGDSGGPLVVFDREGCTYQIGVVSWGPEDCAQAKSYAFYTKTSAMADWIRQRVPDVTDVEPSLVVRMSDDDSASVDAIDAVQDELVQLLPPASEVINVRIREGASLAIGSPLTFEVESSISGKLVLIDIDATGKVTQLYPNTFSSGREIQAGQKIVIDGSEAGFVFRAQPPVGQGRLIAIIGPDAFDATDISGKEARTKGIGVEAAPVSYLSQLVQKVARAKAAGAATRKSDWAFKAADYEIVN